MTCAGRGLATPWLWAVCGLLSALLGGCASDPRERAEAMAAPAGLHRELIDAGGFVLTAYTRITRPDAPIHIYFEGDGVAWTTRTQPSMDPTPRNAVGLALAAADPAPNVAYLARPCQFTEPSVNPRCGVDYWTGKRFSPEIVNAMDAAVSSVARRAPGQPINLVGYSGGGALVVLVAAGRHDVASIRTVGGNLDHAFVNRIHGVSAMPDSENAIDVAKAVASIPQVHFSGGGDTVVPASVAQRYAAAAGGTCIQLRTVPQMAHGDAWGELWPRLLRVTPMCGAAVH